MMKKIYIILATLFVSITSLFADIDAQNIHKIINGVNHAKFSLNRLEALGGVYDAYSIKVGASIEDFSSSIINNNYSVIATSVGSDGLVDIGDEDGTITTRQYFSFPSKMFVGAGMTVNNIGFGLGYQFAHSVLTLDDLGYETSSSNDDDELAGDSLTDRYITSHTLTFGMVLLNGAIEFNIPFSFTVANKEYYSSYREESSSEEKLGSPIGNRAFSVLPSITYYTSGNAFTYITGTLGFGMNKGSSWAYGVDDDGETLDTQSYTSGYATSVSLEVELGLNLLRSPINIAWTPKVYFAVGINSTEYFIDAMDPEAHKAGYEADNVPVLLCVNMPFNFSTSIGTAINLYAEPEVGFFYTPDGGDELDNEYALGLMYGMKAGVEFAPIDDLTFGFDVHAIGGPRDTLESSDFVYVVDNAINGTGSNFTFGVNASLTWRF